MWYRIRGGRYGLGLRPVSRLSLPECFSILGDFTIVRETGGCSVRLAMGRPLARPSRDGAGGTRASVPANPGASDLSGDAAFRQVSLGF